VVSAERTTNPKEGVVGAGAQNVATEHAEGKQLPNKCLNDGLW